jgi:hypothetical protein
MVQQRANYDILIFHPLEAMVFELPEVRLSLPFDD